MKFICYTGWSHLPESANALFELAEQGSLFYSREWFENLTATGLEDDQAMTLACVVADDQVLAILPLIQCEGNTWSSLKHRYTTHYSLLLDDSNRQQVLGCLADGLNQLPNQSLLLEPVAGNDDRINGLQHAMEQVGFNCERVFRHYNWIHRVQGQPYSEYLAGRPARLRNTISRKQRKLQREHGYEIRLFIGNDVPQAMCDYYAIYSASWKANEQYTDFVNGMVASFSRRGWTRLAVLYVNERPVAAQLWFVLHGKANIFRLAYDQAWKKYSPGTILTSYLMEYVIDTDKVKEIDFLTGNDAYKQDWMSERRERYALSCVKKAQRKTRGNSFVESLIRVLKS